MRFEINEKAMKNILEKAVAAIDKKASIDTLKRLYFEVKENSLEVMVQNYNTKTIQLVLHENIFNIDRENGKFAIHVDDIPIITKMNDTITMYIEDEKLYIKSGKKKINIPLYEYTEEAIEKINVNVSTRIMNFPASEFLQTCVDLSTFTSSNNVNDLLSTILLDGKNNRMIALDAHRIALKHIKKEYTVENNIEEDIKLHTYCISILKKIINKKDNNNLSISFDGKYIVIRNDNFKFIIRNVDGQYFNVDQMLVSNGKTFSCNKTELLNIMKYNYSITKKENKVPVVFYQSNEKMNVYCKTERYECVDILETEESYIQDKFMIGFDPKFYVDALEIVKDEKINIEFSKPKSPAFINTEEYTFLILPININESQFAECIEKAIA